MSRLAICLLLACSSPFDMATSVSIPVDTSAATPDCTASRWYADGDGDGFGDPATRLYACGAPAGYVADGTDCEDGAHTVHPGREEECGDGLDNDCDGTDNGCALHGLFALEDADRVWVGTTAGSTCGAAVAAGGDLDRDGGLDVAIGCPGETRFGVRRGGVHVVSGARSGASRPYGELEPHPRTVVDGASMRAYGSDPWGAFGADVAVADLDGDGAADLVVGAPSESGDAEDGGRVHFFSGPLRSGVLEAQRSWIGATGGGRAGGRVRSAGDMDGDGVRDILVAQLGGDMPGTVSAFPSSASVRTIESAAFTWFVGECGPPADGCPDAADAAGDRAGAAIAAADLDGDGVGDVIIGAPRNDEAGVDAGAVYVSLGEGNLGEVALGDAAVVIRGEFAGDALGYSLTAGDITGDGLADLVLGAPRSGAGADGAGAVYLVSGPVLPDSSLADAWRCPGTQEDGAFGSSVAIVGDVNGDGEVEIAVGAPGEDRDEMTYDNGLVWLLWGPHPREDALGAATRFHGPVASNAGAVVAAAGDTNEDGLGDFLVGAPEAGVAEGTPTGAAYLVLGRRW